MKPYEKESELARLLAVRAGEYLKHVRDTHTVIKRPHGTSFLDVTTDADVEAEQIVLDGISHAFPDDAILSEESRSDVCTRTHRLWVIDPLDGTTNFVTGLDAYGVSISLLVDGVVVMAVNYLPETRTEYFSIRNAGVYKNGERLLLRRPDDSLAGSLVSIGFPHTRDEKSLSRAFSLYQRILSASSDLRRSASAAYDACLLAEGITGAYVTPDIKPWDIAAMTLFTTEQGGVVSGMNGEPLNLFLEDNDKYRVAIVAAKSPAIHESLLAAISICA